MPSWSDILLELRNSAQFNNGAPDFDGIRRKYLVLLQQHTQRSTILYATDWLSGGSATSSITLEDMQGLMEVCRGLPGPNLDLILHSPGGSAEATASIVRYIRSKFDHVRVFVPLAAMSAGTMWALSGNEVVMGKHSQLGPIDPQIFRPQEGRYVPARAIVEQFERAKRECADDPRVLGAWLPILQQLGTSVIEECEHAEELGRGLVAEWLELYMFAGHADAHDRAAAVATYFADYGTHRSHALGIDRDHAAAQGVNVQPLEADQILQDLVLSVHHATMHTFQGPAVKIVENHFGRAWVKTAQPQIQGMMPMLGGAPFPSL